MMPYALPPSLRRTLALLPLLSACSQSAGGPEYTQLGVGAGRAGAVADLECTRLPVMPGGIVQREFELNGGVRAWLRGTRDGAEVKFSGIEAPHEAQRSFSHETLDTGFVERINVVTLAGDDFVIVVNSGCGDGVTL